MTYSRQTSEDEESRSVTPAALPGAQPVYDPSVAVGANVADFKDFKAVEFSNSWPLLLTELAVLVLWSVATGLAYHWTQIDVPIYLAQLTATGLLIAITYCSAERNFRPKNAVAERRRLESFLRGLTCWCGSFLVLNFFAFSFHIGQDFSRGAVLTFFLTGLPVLMLARVGVTNLLARRIYETSLRWSDAVIVGCSQQVVASTAGVISARGCVAPSIVTIDPGCSNSVWAMELQSALRQTMNFAHRVHRGAIYVCAQDFPADRLQMLLDGLRVIPRSVRIIPDAVTAQLLSHRMRKEAGGISLEVQRSPLTEGQRFSKRLMDVVISSVLLVVLFPLLVTIAILIKLDSKGPVIFRQARLGYRGQPYNIYKFRTMSVLENGLEIAPATKNDPRITRIGHFLRRSSLDELLQLLNVIRGEMSLVGPRPHAVAHDNLYGRTIPNYDLRQHVLPGMTGWAQVHGLRGEANTTDLMWRRVEYDLWYTKNASLALDLEILLRTIAVVFGQEADAYDELGKIQLFRGQFTELLTKLGRRTGHARIVVTPNVDHYRMLSRSSAFRRAYRNADFIVNDSRLLDGIALRGTVLCAPGADLVPILMQTQDPGRKVCVVGYTPEVRATLPSRFPELVFSFVQPSMGYIRKRKERRALVGEIAALDPDLLLVCTGAPQSEIFAAQIKKNAKTRSVVVCCGSALEFLCGTKRRAPSMFRRGRAEWLWRFIDEPRTRARYFLDMIFLLLSAISLVRLRFGRRAHFKKFSIEKK